MTANLPEPRRGPETRAGVPWGSVRCTAGWVIDQAAPARNASTVLEAGR